MKFKHFISSFSYRERFSALFFKQLKLISLCLLFAVSNALASAYGQKIILREKSVRIESVFKIIEKQTDYLFLYSKSDIPTNMLVDANVKSKDIHKVMDELIAALPLTYKIFGNQIVLKKANLQISETTPIKVTEAEESVIVKSITGKVTDENDEPLIGVSVTIKDMDKGTTTNENGDFTLEMEQSAKVLVFSYIGFETQEVTIGNQTVMIVKLMSDQKLLEEVVVVGYGTQKLSDVTGSVARLDEKILKSRPVANFQDAIVGRTAGVLVKQTGGDLSGRFSINIRGVGSVTGGNSPLVVVDGIPLFTGDFSMINPKDIVSIDILKDASATAIFGARASNGVLMITTRRGTSGKTEYSFSASVGTEEIAKRYDVLSTEGQRKLFVQAFKNSNRNSSAYEDISNPVWSINTDWQDLISQTGVRQEYSFGANGGDPKSRFAVSGSYLDRKGTILGTELTSFFFRANNDIQVSKRIKIASSLAFTTQNSNPVNNDSYHGGAYKDAISNHRHFQPYDENGKLFAPSISGDPYFGSNGNPLIGLLLPTRDQNRTRILGSFKADWKIIDELTLSGNFGTDMIFLSSYYYSPLYTIGLSTSPVGNTSEDHTRGTNRVTDLTLEYAKVFQKKHDLKLLAGSSVQSFRSKFFNINGNGTVDNALDQLNNQTTFTGGGGDYTTALASLFGRLNYGYNGRYLFTGTIRRDGSTKFGANKRYGLFPSMSFAWRVIEEPFMESQNVFSDLKFRVGYGLTGNQEISDFAYISRAGSSPYVFGNNIVVGNGSLNLGNPNLQWESAKQVDLGVDLGLFKSRVQLTLDYYLKKSENLLIRTPLPLTAGVPENPTINIGSLQNMGIEFGINTVNTTGKLGWTTNLNLTLNKNKVLDIGFNSVGDPLQIQGYSLDLPGEPANLTVVDRPIASFYMYNFIGVWQTPEKELAAQFGAVPGDPRYADLNGNGKFDTGDKSFVGNPNPTFFGGINNGLKYGPFSLNVFFNFAMGNKLFNSMRNLNARGVPFNQQLAEVGDFWTEDNPSNKVPRPSQGGNTTFLVTRVSTRYLEKADFLRLKDLSLSYSLAPRLTEKLKLKGASVTLQATNLLTFTEYQGLDPEASSRGELTSAGIDLTPYPVTRMYSASLQINF